MNILKAGDIGRLDTQATAATADDLATLNTAGELVKTPVSAVSDSLLNNGGTFTGNVTFTGDVTLPADTDFPSSIKTAKSLVSLANINAGFDITPSYVPGEFVTPKSVTIKCSGTFLTGTSIDVEIDVDGPVFILASFPVAALLDGVVLGFPDSTDNTGLFTTVGTAAPFPTIRVIKDGSDFTGGTSIEIFVDYFFG